MGTPLIESRRKMASKKRAKKRNAKKLERKEQRFEPAPTHASWGSFAVGAVGAALLGAGVYAQWLVDEPYGYGLSLVGVGAAGLLGGLWLGNQGLGPLHVGDAGIATEQGEELTRIPWCEIQSVSLSTDTLIVKTGDSTLSIALGEHPQGTSLIVKEIAKRLPARLKLSEAQRDALPKVSRRDGETRIVTELQVAGKRCAASSEIVTFEKDARLCPNCGELFARSHTPNECVTCAQPLGSAAVAI